MRLAVLIRVPPCTSPLATGLPRSPLKELSIKISDTHFAFYCRKTHLNLLVFVIDIKKVSN